MGVAGVGGVVQVPARLLTVETPDQARALARLAATPELTAPQLALAIGLPVAEVDGLVEAYQAALQKLLNAAGFWFPKGAAADAGVVLAAAASGTVLGEDVDGSPAAHQAYSKVAGLRPAPGSGQAVAAPIFARIALKVGVGDAAVLLLVDDEGVVTGAPPQGVIPSLLQHGTSRGAVVLVEVAATPTGAVVPAEAPPPGQYAPTATGSSAGGADSPTATGPSSASAASTPSVVPGGTGGAAEGAIRAGTPQGPSVPPVAAGQAAPDLGQGAAPTSAGQVAPGSAGPVPLPPGLPAPPRAHPFQVGAPLVQRLTPASATVAGTAPAATAATAAASGASAAPPSSAAIRAALPPLVAAMTDPVGGYRAWPASPRAPVPVPVEQIEALARQAAPPVPPVSLAPVATRPAEVHDLLTRVARQPLDIVADARSIPAAIDLAVRDPAAVRRLVIDLTALLGSARAGLGMDPPPVPSPTDPDRVRELLAASLLGRPAQQERRRKGSPLSGPGRRTLAEHFFAALFSLRVAEQIGQVEVPITLLGPEDDEAIRLLLERVAEDLANGQARFTDEPEVLVLEIIRERS